MDKIEHIFYINLDKREDRRKEIEDELLNLELFDKSERFSAIYNTNGGIGCSLSHLEILKMAKERKYKNCLILEDDFEFLIYREDLDSLLNIFFSQINSYDVLMLGVNLPQTEKVNENENENKFILKLNSGQTTSAYIIHEKYYDLQIHLLENSIKMLEKTNLGIVYATDQIWKIFMPIREFYTFSVRVGKQRPSFSDICNEFVDYNV
jgi:glycosyl transferase family 25